MASIVMIVMSLMPRASAVAAQAAPMAGNVVALTVKTPRGGFNRMVVSVTLCAPATDRCTTIDDVMVDTGSTGLRIEASAMPSALHLPAFLGPNGAPLAECLRFVHSAAWGPLVRADVRLGGLTAPSIPIQVIEDGPHEQPGGCPVSNVRPTANGTLGVGPHLLDCQGTCDQVTMATGVFGFHEGSWAQLKGPVVPAFRVPNPVSRFPVHGNGVVIDLPTVKPGGEAEVTGTLTFGVDTAVNNGLGEARIVRLDRRGFFTTLYDGVAYPDSYLDSGTMAYIVGGGRIPRCARMAWALCLEPSRAFAATMIGTTGEETATSFSVGDYQAVGDHRLGAFDGAAIAADEGSKSFVWGASYFLGKRIVLVFEGRGASGKMRHPGPFFAIK